MHPIARPDHEQWCRVAYHGGQMCAVGEIGGRVYSWRSEPLSAWREPYTWRWWLRAIGTQRQRCCALSIHFNLDLALQ